MTYPVTLAQLKQIVALEGFTPLDGASFEDDTQIYSSSVEIFRHCYGHPQMEVQYMKASGYLSITGRGAVRLTPAPRWVCDSTGNWDQQIFVDGCWVRAEVQL